VTTSQPAVAQPPPDVPAAGGDVESLHALGRLTPLDHEVEVGPRCDGFSLSRYA
jgi:hypothetical protein